MHSLPHFVEKVENLGPLWAHFCFHFEDFNGELRRIFHCSQYVEMQIMLAINIQQCIPELVLKLDPGSSAYLLYNSMTMKRHTSIKKEIGDVIFMLGHTSHCTNSTRREMIERYLGRNVNIKVLYRILLKGHVIHCTEYCLCCYGKELPVLKCYYWV